MCPAGDWTGCSLLIAMIMVPPTAGSSALSGGLAATDVVETDLTVR